MRILYFINGFDPGGAEHGLLTLVESEFFAGHDLRVVGMCRGRGGLADALANALGREKVRIVEDEERLSLKACLMGAVSLAAEIRRFRPDAVILSLKQANVVGRLVLHAFPKIRCISFEHISRYRARRAERIYGSLLTLLSSRVDEIWSDCAETLEATRSYFKPRKRREAVIPLFRAARDRGTKTDYGIRGHVRIAAAGRLVGRKNFDRIILAVKNLNATGLAAKLAIFGDGPELEALKVLARRCGIPDKISLLGYRERWFDEALEYDLFVNASDTEGFCIVVAEAMGVGLPIIATNVGGIREYGYDGENMLKLKDDSVEALTASISQLAGDLHLRERLGRRAGQDIGEMYSEHAIRECGQAVLGDSNMRTDAA